MAEKQADYKCGFLGQFCVILHSKFQTKNWEFFMVHHLKKSNKSTKCDPKGQNYHLQPLYLNLEKTRRAKRWSLLAPRRKLAPRRCLNSNFNQALEGGYRRLVGANVFLKVDVYPYSRWRTLTFFLQWLENGGKWVICCGKQVKIWLTFFGIFLQGEKNHSWLNFRGQKNSDVLVFGEGSLVTMLRNFNEQFLDNINLHG